MNQPTMTNEQFALWISPSISIAASSHIEKAQIIFDWLEINRRKALRPTVPITPKGK